MGVVLGAQHQASPHQPAEEIEESGRPVQLHERRGFFTDSMVTDTPSLFVSGNVVAVQLGLETICLRDQVLFHRLSREKPFEKDELVLIQYSRLIRSKSHAATARSTVSLIVLVLVTTMC